jgi:hypothetical protein
MKTSVITIKNNSRIELICPHQNGITYVVPSESNWVCSDELKVSHSLAGFFNDISNIDDAKILSIMQKWGIYYRTNTVIKNA